MRKLIFIVLACCIAGPASAGVSDSELQKIADEINKRAPMMVDDQTQLTGATGKSNTLTYNYKMLNYTAAQLDKSKFISILKPQLVKAACPKIKIMLDAGIRTVYTYNDKNDALIAAITLDKNTCN
jgi:hypothetical protein